MNGVQQAKGRICWVTPDYFYCVDATVVPKLMESYRIDWFIVYTSNSQRDTAGIAGHGARAREIRLRYRQKDPRVMMSYRELIRCILETGCDLVYISFHGLPYFFPLFFRMVGARTRVIYGAHNASTPRGASNELLMRLYHDYVFNRIENFHVFSRSQFAVVARQWPGKRTFYAPLSLVEYGPSQAQPPPDRVRFLFFGYIRDYKRLDLLLKAFQQLWDAGVRGIELQVAGECSDWDRYRRLITHPEAVSARIGVVPNREIPDVVSSCHYMVLPYQDIAQSAVLTLAYQYRKPVIVSDIEPFREYVREGETGFFFESGSQESLAEVLARVVEGHGRLYHRMAGNVASFVAENYSGERIVEMYRAFLDRCLES